jgi:very-short-patch-repair endonuclease
MASLSPSALRVISQCHGVVTSQQLISFGLSDTQIGRLVETGQLLRERHSVFRHAAAPRTLDQRLALACAVSPSVAISHQSAGRKRGLRRLGRDQRIHATIPGRSHIRIPGVVIHRSHLILPTDVVEQDDGIRITSVERTIFDLANVVSIHAIESIIEQAIHDELCSISSLHVLGSRLCRQGRNGSERFRQVLDSRPEWWTAVDTDLELRLEQAIVAAGLPRPIRQFEITLPDGSDIHPDLYWPDPPIVLEVDHSSWHGGREQQTYDKWRDRQLTRVGVRPMRVSEDDIRFRLESVIADLASVLRK